ncbi:PCMD domain-containing protein [Bacteroides bouchesdurhonensis]|uniref:PCMD domain-containing protein n=1 Tax=Bacteroides bouchesdurhonensis TaxID=1841855 RepID=UPI00097F9348|nr:PCMD domain-containing protein [Bacteroides bouchesdurhonensis]
MKRNLFYLFVLLCLAMSFTACSDDDKTQYIQDGEFDGVYLGTLDVDAGDLGKESDIPQKIYISKTGENQIKMELKKFSYPGIGELGDIKLDGIKVVKEGNSCSFTGAGVVKLLVGDCNLSVSGLINDGKLTMNINVLVAVLNVDVNFTGTKLATDKSSEANILTYSFDNDLVINQPVIDGTDITFIVSDDITDEQLSTLIPTFTISKGAVVDKPSGVAQDFTSPVIYTVTSEDGIFKKQYTVSVGGKEINIKLDEWTTVNTETSGSNESFQTPIGKYGTSNPGLMQINDMFGQIGVTFDYPVIPVEGKEGKAAQVKTIYTFIYQNDMDFNEAFGGMIPYVTSGSLFTGSFKTDMLNPLNSTKFGVPFVGEPATLSGSYKYTPGDIYYDNKNKVITDKTDEFSIYAVLYEEALDENNNNIPLTGDYNDENVYIGTSPRIIMRAALEYDGPKDDWTDFSIPFKLLEGKTYDPSKNYYIAVVCASSAEGDFYQGAPGSTLIVDNFKVTPR